MTNIALFLSNNGLEIFFVLLTSFSGGYFAALCTNIFESRRRIKDKRLDKYNDHRNTLVQLEHEIIPLRVNMSRNLRSLEISQEATNAIRLILRFYNLKISSGLSLHILNLDLINSYSELYIKVETINSDMHYLEDFIEKIKNDIKENTVDENLIATYPLLIENLHNKCIEADDMSLELLSKIKHILSLEDTKTKKIYLKNGKLVDYEITESDIEFQTQKTRDEEAPIESDTRTQFVAPYLDVRKM